MRVERPPFFLETRQQTLQRHSARTLQQDDFFARQATGQQVERGDRLGRGNEPLAQLRPMRLECVDDSRSAAASTLAGFAL